MSGVASYDHHQPSTPPPRRARRSRRRIRQIVAPSSSLLSLLATVVASLPAVDASPIPLSFLCPRYRQDIAAVEETCRRDVSYSSTVLSTQVRKRLGSRTVPIKYEQGSDGQWRRVDTYTLYGSTMCPSCSASSYQASSGTSEDSTTTSASASPSVGDILDTLPNGWRPQNREPRTALIVTLSLALAFIICLLIIGCLYWRNRRRRKPKEDIEMDTYKRRKQPIADDEEVLSQGGTRKKKKAWARATARWKANTRHSARQRRGRRAFNVNQPPLRPEAALENVPDAEDLSSGTVSPSWSRHSSRRSSVYSVEGAQPVIIVPPTEFSGDSRAFPSDPTIVSDIPPSSPPAYHHSSRLSVPEIQICTTGLAPPSDGPASSSPLTPYHSRQPSQSSGGHLSSNEDSEELGYSPSAHAAHVATDDKALLQRLTRFASSPPQDGSILVQHQESSAPIWQDEQLDAFTDVQRPSRFTGDGSSPSPSSSLFPAPPVPLSSKGKAASEYYEYEYTYPTFDDDIQSLEPELGPSAPPFEAVTSGPALELHELVPSAPPPEIDVDGAENMTAELCEDASSYEHQGAAGETELPLQNVDEGPSLLPPHYRS